MKSSGKPFVARMTPGKLSVAKSVRGATIRVVRILADALKWARVYEAAT